MQKNRRNRRRRRILINKYTTKLDVIMLALAGLFLILALCIYILSNVQASKKARMEQTKADDAVRVEKALKKQKKHLKELEKKRKKAEKAKKQKKQAKNKKKDEKKADNMYSIDGHEGELFYDEPYYVTKHPLNTEDGTITFEGHKETYYSTREIGQTVTTNPIPGKHAADDGTIRDKDGYVCVAVPQGGGWLDLGEKVFTSLGPGKVYDYGGMSGYWIDIYTDW